MRAPTLLLLLAAGCPTPAPVPPGPPDADAAPPIPAQDAGPIPDACARACAVMQTLCGPQEPDCADTMTRIDKGRTIRTASGTPLTCSAVAAAQTKADLAAVGAACP